MKKNLKQHISRSKQAAKPNSGENFNQPFAALGDLLEQVQDAPQPVGKEEEIKEVLEGSTDSPEQPKGESVSEDRDSMFLEAMTGVEPLDYKKVQPRPPGPLAKPCRRPLIEGELEAYAQLLDLVSGGGPFDIQYTDEYVEGAIAGVDPELLPKLRRGDFSIQAHLDLHGMSAAQGRQSVERFIHSSVIQGLRCILIIHGRGLNSRDQIPILKERMSRWLKRGRLKQLVLAFATAQPCDGGAGAMYVLLRKRLPDKI
jgi:DNA-nicking Smr family endonuclease